MKLYVGAAIVVIGAGVAFATGFNPIAEHDAKKKTRTVKATIAGFDENADQGQLQSAYEGLLQKLDPALVPEGSAQALLRENVRQLRSKVTDAFQHLSNMD